MIKIRNLMPSARMLMFMISVLSLIPLHKGRASDQFSISPVYLQDYFKNNEDRYYRFHGPALNVSFYRDGALPLLFSLSAGTPIGLVEDGSKHTSYEYYSSPASLNLLAGPVWSFPLGDVMVFEPSLGLQAGFINLKGTGYTTVRFAPLGLGTDLNLKARVNPEVILGIHTGVSWHIIDLQHYSEHSTGYSVKAGISIGFAFDAGRSERKKGNRE
ncbi:MAG: hypothetical protein PQJ58_00830 [Spirochaetales bacterium]|nr:hypothetical protein [Spirochaetales bacterium]